MTEKRFVETISTGIVTDNVTGKEYRCEMRIDEDLLELLNELHEENEHYKSRLEYLERKIQRERIASTKQHLKWSKEAEEQIQILAKENEQLKEQIKELNLKMTRDLNDFLRK